MASSDATSVAYKLTYFDGRGKGEQIRTMFVVSGVDFDNETRSVSEAPFTGEYPENFDRLPILKVVDGSGEHIIGQSSAIRNYVAKKLNMYGSNEFESAKIDQLCAHVQDCKDSLKPFFNSGNGTPASEDWEKYFDLPSDAAGRDGRCIRWYLKQINKQVGTNGFAVGNSFTLADATIYNIFGESCEDLAPLHYTGKPGDFARYPFCASTPDKVQKCLEEEAPNVLKIVENFRNNPNMQTWLNNRGTMAF